MWEHLARHGVPFRNYGEGFEFAGVDEDENERRTGAREVVNIPMSKVLYDNTCREFPIFNMNIPDQYRAHWFMQDFTKRGFWKEKKTEGGRRKIEANKPPATNHQLHPTLYQHRDLQRSWNRAESGERLSVCRVVDGGQRSGPGADCGVSVAYALLEEHGDFRHAGRCGRRTGSHRRAAQRSAMHQSVR